jgi:polyisoprenoid-binding protein YceI
VEVDIQLDSFDSGDETRDAHIRSGDFFDVEQHPTATYRSTKVNPSSSGRWSVEGELTIKGNTRPVTLDVSFEGAATDPFGNSKVFFEATADIDRDEFGVNFNAPLETGGVLLGKNVKLELEIQAVRS